MSCCPRFSSSMICQYFCSQKCLNSRPFLCSRTSKQPHVRSPIVSPFAEQCSSLAAVRRSMVHSQYWWNVVHFQYITFLKLHQGTSTTQLLWFASCPVVSSTVALLPKGLRIMKRITSIVFQFIKISPQNCRDCYMFG